MFIDNGNAHTDQAFNVDQIFTFVYTAKRQRHTTGPGAPGASDAMDIAFGLVGQVEINDVRNVININSTRGDVSGYQNLNFATFEI